jgi:OFA family oxalate/formate antiporter-like MFS transporter
MFAAFMIEAVGIWALIKLGHDPVAFVILSGTVFFAWGEIFSLFPATCGDVYGPKYAATNAGLLYTAKGTAALLVPLANVVTKSTGSWDTALVFGAVLAAVAGFMAIFVLKPMRIAHAERYHGRALPVCAVVDDVH